MKRKIIIGVVLVCLLSLTSCGKKATNADKIETLQQDVAASEEVVSDLETELQEANELIAELKEKESTLTTGLSALEERVKSLEDEVSGLQTPTSSTTQSAQSTQDEQVETAVSEPLTTTDEGTLEDIIFWGASNEYVSKNEDFVFYDDQYLQTPLTDVVLNSKTIIQVALENGQKVFCYRSRDYGLVWSFTKASLCEVEEEG